jgi:hypothetical protein
MAFSRVNCLLPQHDRFGLHSGGIAIPLHLDVRTGQRRSRRDSRVERDFSGAKILFEPVKICRAGDRNNPGFLDEQPGERDLRAGHLFACGDPAQEIDEGVVRPARLFREARHDVAEIVLPEPGLVADCAGQKNLSERAEGH